MGFSNLVELFLDRAQKSPLKQALWFKRQGRFLSINWTEFAEQVRQTALGLYQWGVRPGDRIGLLSENRPEWAFVDLGILSLGAVTVPIYPTTSEKDCLYILEHAEISLLFVSSPEQLKKVHPSVGHGKLERVVCFDLEKNESASVLSFRGCLEAGRLAHLNNGGLYQQLAGRAKRDDVATLIYTSGTTGPPKGVMLTHGNFLSNCEASAEAMPLGEDERSLSFLPLSHVFERMAGYYFMIQQGATIAYAESMQTVPEDIKIVRPTMAASVPRFFEKIHAKILEAVQAGPPLRKKIFAWALKTGEAAGKCRQEKRPLSGGLKLRYLLAGLLVFNKLKRALGGRIKFFISGGAPLSKELAEFFYAAGVLILEGYGLTETAPVISVNRPEKFKFGTVGLRLSNVEVQIAPDGEILTRGPHVMKGYFKNDEATREAIRDGWFHTGDIGELDKEGFLKITDRKKDLIKTAGGKNISPQNIEGELLKDPLFTQVVTIGDRRPYLVALILPNRQELERLAATEGIQTASWEALLKDPKVLKKVDERLRQRTKDFASYEQIKYFHLLPRELSQEAGELTPTLKVKRRIVMERYASVIEAMYEKGEVRSR